MKNSHHTPFILILLTCGLFLGEPLHQVRAQSKTNPVKIGMLIPLTGQYAPLGTDFRQGIEIAKAEIPSTVELDFVYADSRAEPLQAAVEFRKLVDIDKVAGVFVVRGPAGMSVNPLSKSAKLPLLGSVGNKNFALSNEYAFQLWPRSDFEGEFIAKAIHSRGLKNIAILTVQDDYTIAVSDGVRSTLKSLGANIKLDQEVLPAEADFRTQIGTLRRLEPDAIFLNVGIAQIAPMLKQLRQAGIVKPIYSNFWAGKSEVLADAGRAADGVLYAEMATNLPELKADLKAKFNSSPSGATLSAYLATLMLAQAALELTDVTSSQLFAKLVDIKEIKSKSGNFAVKDRFVQFPMALRMIVDGKPADS